MTLMDAIIAYTFWIWSKKIYGYDGIRSFFYEWKKRKLAKSIGFDEYHFQKVQGAIEVIQQRLKDLR